PVVVEEDLIRDSPGRVEPKTRRVVPRRHVGNELAAAIADQPAEDIVLLVIREDEAVLARPDAMHALVDDAIDRGVRTEEPFRLWQRGRHDLPADTEPGDIELLLPVVVDLEPVRSSELAHSPPRDRDADFALLGVAIVFARLADEEGGRLVARLVFVDDQGGLDSAVGVRDRSGREA